MCFEIFCFSDQEIKIVIHHAYICFELGTSLRNKLEVEDSTAFSGKICRKSSLHFLDGSSCRQTPVG